MKHDTFDAIYHLVYGTLKNTGDCTYRCEDGSVLFVLQMRNTQGYVNKYTINDRIGQLNICIGLSGVFLFLKGLSV